MKVAKQIGIVKNKKLNSIFLFTIIVFSNKIFVWANIFDPSNITPDWFIMAVESN